MAETTNTPKEVMGVKKSIIQERLNNYRRQVYGLSEEQKAEIQSKIETTLNVISRLRDKFDEDQGNTKVKEQLERNERNLQELRNELANSGPTVEPNTPEYYRMADVIPELEDILAHADPNLEYIPVEEIHRRLEAQKRLKEELEAAQREGTPAMSEEDIRIIEAQIAALEIEYERLNISIENPDQNREVLLAEKEALERRIAEIRDRLSQTGGRKALSPEERADLDGRLAAANAALNAQRDTLNAKNRELDNLKRQRDEEIARINAEVEEVVVESTPEDFRDQAENKLREYAEQHGIDPSELRIVRTEIEDYDDGPSNEFSIVRVRTNNEPVLTTDERAGIENELREAEEELNNLNNNSRNPNEMDLDTIIAELDRQIRELTDQIVANNETYANSEKRMEANQPLLDKRKALETQRRILNELRTNSTKDIDAQISSLRDQVVANNESYANSEKRMEANQPLLDQIKELEAKRSAARNATAGEYLANIDEQLREARRKLRENGERRNDPNVDYVDFRTTNTELTQLIFELEAQRNAIVGLDLDNNAQRRQELTDKVNDLKNRLRVDDERRAKYPRLQQLDAQIAGLENEIKDIEAEIQRLVDVVADLERQVREDDQIRREDEAALTDEERAKIEKQLEDARRKLRENGERRRDPNVDYVDFRTTNTELTQLIFELESRLKLDTARRERIGNAVGEEERKALEAELKEKEDRLAQVNEALENPDKTRIYIEKERARIRALIIELQEKVRKGREIPGKEGVDNSEQIRIAENKIKELEELEKLKESFKVKETPAKGEPIEIPEYPDLVIELDDERIKNEYARRKHDMYAKYYGDKEYQAEYDERAARYRDAEGEAIDENGVTYRTVRDYEQRAADEEFLLLDKYKDCLERMSKDEAGIEVYHGTPEEIEAQRARDREYVETRNHTFDQHKFTQKDLATMGKYGEKMPYIPKQEGVLKNIGRGILNVGIFARNVVAPVYRGIGKFIAQPIHRLVTGGKDASPYRNNFYHRMVARREYFEEQGRRRDIEETNRRMAEAEPGEEVKPVRHPIRNWAAARWNAIFKSKEGNEAVLNAGEHDIQENIIAQEKSEALLRGLDKHKADLLRQAAELQERLDRNPNAPNADEVRQAIETRKAGAAEIDAKKKMVDASKEGTKQTDAVSYKTHAVARKEVNTLRTTVIKGVVKGVAAKYVGPAIEKWLLEHSKIKSKEWVEGTTKQEWVEGTTKQEWVEGTTVDKIEPIYGDSLPTGKTVQELIAEKAGTEYTGWYSVSGGHRGPSNYTLSGNEKITGWWVDNGTKWGTGVSDSAGLTAPTLTDRLVNAGLMSSNGVFRQDVEPAEILRICQMEGIDPSKVYVSVGDNHWAKAADLFGIEQVKIGENIISEYVPGHWETIDIPGYWDTVDVPGYWKDVIIDNPRVVKFISGGKTVIKAGMVADGVQDVAENLRNTHTDVPEHKPQPRVFERSEEAKEYFGDEEHPTSKREYDQRRREERDLEDDDDAR